MSRESPPGTAASSLRAGTRIPIAVPASGRLYEGHFPGRPILPGVALLHLALRALSASGGPDALREIPVLRLRRLVAPGEKLELEIKAFQADGRARIEMRRSGEGVAGGVVVLAEPSADVPPPTSLVGVHPPAVVPDLDELLPHRPPMRFVTGVEGETEEGVICSARVPERSALAEAGWAPALVALEMAAQSAAVFEALRRLREAQDRGPRIGYVVGARDVLLRRARIRAGVPFSAAIRLSGFAPPLSTYSFEVAGENEVVASGTVSTWLSPRAS